MLTQYISKSIRLIRDFSVRLNWFPLRVRFCIQGHGHAWGIFTHMTPQERLLLYWLGLQQPSGAILLEVGSYLGASACFLAAAASGIKGEARVHCVDTWQNHAMSEGLRDTWTEFHNNTQAYSPFIVPHQGLSVDVAKSFNGKLNLLFLDGDHSYEGCRTDLLAWLPHLTSGGLLVMHDYTWAAGVRRVVEEVIRPLERERGQVLHNTYWSRM